MTVRRVSSALGVTAAALYWHLTNKEELVAALVDRGSQRTERPGPDYGHWLDRLVQFFSQPRAVQCVRRVEPGPHDRRADRLDDAQLPLRLRAADRRGVRQRAAITLFDALSTLSWGHLMMLDTARHEQRPSAQ